MEDIMNKFLKRVLFTILLIITGDASAMSMQHTSQIYNRIVQSNGFRIAPRLIEDSSNDINASSGGFRIIVNNGMLKFLNDDNQMALVLGHELAHYKLGHSHSSISNEYAADHLGAIFMQRAGYNKCQGAIFFKRLPYGDSVDHPASWKRIKALGC